MNGLQIVIDICCLILDFFGVSGPLWKIYW